MKLFRKPSGRFRIWLWIIQLTLLAILVLTVYVGWEISRPLNISADKTYVFSSGDSIAHLVARLKENNEIDRPWVLVWTARIGRFDRRLKAGEYEFQPEFNTLDLLNHIVEGKYYKRVIRFIEGWTFADYLRQIRSNQHLEHTLKGLTTEQILDELAIDVNHPEGWFFPATYQYQHGQSDAEILLRAYEKMKSTLYSVWENRAENLPYTTAYQCLIVASIIEKESGVLAEFPIVAGVIVNRLRKGMRLQMDPTVIYGAGGIEGPIKRSHLQQDTAYNTYTRAGLPPTPIAMPGLAALKAAANPAKTTAYYFVAKGDGSHTFSETLEQHNAAVKEYRKLQDNN